MKRLKWKLSLKNKCWLLWKLAWKLEKRIPQKNFTDDEIDLIYFITEGFYMYKWNKVQSGECSLRESLNFDIEVWENQINTILKNIRIMCRK